MPKSKKSKKKMSPEKIALIKELAGQKTNVYGTEKTGNISQDGGSKVGASGSKEKQVKTSSGDR